MDAPLALFIMAFLVGPWAIICLYIGFRMGRQSIDKPLPPISKRKVTPGSLVDEDPFFEAMHGRDQNRPTMEG